MLRTFVDGNHVGFVAHSIKTRLMMGDVDTTGIFHAVKKIREIVAKVPESKPVVLWDGRSWRYDAATIADYKGTRDDNAKAAASRTEYKQVRPHIARGFKFLGLTQAIVPNWEADDLAALLTRKAVEAGDKVMLVTGDKDWIQLVQPGVIWFDHRFGRTCTTRNFTEYSGGLTSTQQFIQLKALEGDIGDNVKGVKGIGGPGAVEFLMVYGSVDRFLSMDLSLAQDEWVINGGKSKNLPKKFVDFHTQQEKRDAYAESLMLVDLNHADIPPMQKLRIENSKVDAEGFKSFCLEFGFNSIVRDLDAFLEPFYHNQMEIVE